MAAMKVTTSAAMRARDVSRPHAEHLAAAETAEARAASGRPAGPAAPLDAPDPANTAGVGAAAPGDELLREAGIGDRAREAAQARAGRDGAGRDGAGRESGRADGGRADGGRARAGGPRRRWRPRGSGRGRASR